MSEQYRSAGVDIAAGNRAVEMMREAVQSTYTAQVLADVGSFGGLFALGPVPEDAVLAASTDGVGTKVKLAAELGQWRGIGHDIVNHCVNDILVQGAQPLFFLDYIASSRLVPEQVAEVVIGVAEACRAVGCVLLGGETAEMPGVYTEGAFDVAGTVVGVVTRRALLPRPDEMRPGDLLFGLPSSGPHTNGYTLIRKLVAGRDLAQPLHEGDPSLGSALLAPHRCYGTEVARLQQSTVDLKGLAHITGGGFVDNVPRILPSTLAATLEPWEEPPLFAALREWGGMGWEEAAHVFNQGIGMVLVIGPDSADALRALLPEARQIGVLAPREGEQPAVRWSTA